MANRIRSPQIDPDCANDPTNPRCGGHQAVSETTQDIATTTRVVQDGTTDIATQVPTSFDSATNDAGVTVTTTGTNLDGVVWTSSYTIYPTEAATTGPTSSTIAAVTETPSTAQATSKSSSNDGVSKGAVAGIAIGTCIVGAAVAFVIAWLLFKRRDRKIVQKTCPSGYPIYADSSPELVMVQKSAATGSPYVQVSQTQMRTPVPVPARVPVATQQAATGDALAGVLPPATNEHDVRNRVSALFAQIHRHVDTYYRDVHASITPSMDSDLASFGQDVDMLELLQNCSSPTVALKHALVAFVLNITGPAQDGGEQTLWPNELTHVLSPHNSASAQLATAQVLHRRLTIYLYTRTHSLPPTNSSQARLSNLSALSLTRKTSSAIREAAEHFSLTFFPWANPAFGDQERESDLAGIIGEALECRIWLAGQIWEWGFEWEGVGRGAVVVAPGVVVREVGGPRRVVVDQTVVGI